MEEDLKGFNLRDLANSAWGISILGQGKVHEECMQAIGQQAVESLDRFDAQQTSKLLYAFGLSHIRCPPLERAAGERRWLKFHFAAPVGLVRVQQMIGGTQREHAVREATGAMAGNGGALFEDAFVLAEWLSR